MVVWENMSKHLRYSRHVLVWYKTRRAVGRANSICLNCIRQTLVPNLNASRKLAYVQLYFSVWWKTQIKDFWIYVFEDRYEEMYHSSDLAEVNISVPRISFSGSCLDWYSFTVPFRICREFVYAIFSNSGQKIENNQKLSHALTES